MYRQTPIARTPCACYLEFQTHGWLDPSDERAILLLGQQYACCFRDSRWMEREVAENRRYRVRK